MTSVNTSAQENLRLGSVRAILNSPGPCATIVLEPYRPGEPGGSPGAVLKSFVDQNIGELETRRVPADTTANLVRPLLDLAADPGFDSGSHLGRAILRSGTAFEQFPLAQPLAASCTLGSCFAIRKLADELARPDLVYLLILRKNGVSLMRSNGLEVEAVKLPAGVPETLLEAMQLEAPDHDLENRSSSGTSTGSMHRVRFGTGSMRENESVYLADYYKIVDRGLRDLLREREAPLILVGTQEDIGKYRAVNTYRHLAKQGVAGSLDLSVPREKIIQEALAILKQENNERHASAVVEAKEHFAPARFSTDFDATLRAAFEGRVNQLYVNEGAHRSGAFEWGRYRSWENEDLLNLAMVQTLIHHGEAYVLPKESMPNHSPVAAILRY